MRSVEGKLERLKDKAAREIKRQHEIKIRDKEIARLRSVLRSERKHIKKLKKTLERQKKMEIIEETHGLLKLKPLSAFTREAVLLATSGLDGGVAAATAIVARVIFIGVDAVGALVSAPTATRRRGGVQAGPLPDTVDRHDDRAPGALDDEDPHPA